VPLLAVEDGLDRVDAAIDDFALGRFAVGSRAGFVGAPQMSHVIPAFGADFDLAFIEDGVSTFGYGVDPVLDGEDAGCGCAVRRDADGDETGIGREEAAEAGAIFVAGAADGVVDGLDEVAEGGGRRAGHDVRRRRGGSLGVECGEQQGGENGYDNRSGMHMGILQKDRENWSRSTWANLGGVGI
jgi:hypothetical protein